MSNPSAELNDCEDQGFGLISDGCSRCVTDEIVLNPEGQKVRKHQELIREDGYWRCPNCGGSYGAVLPEGAR